MMSTTLRKRWQDDLDTIRSAAEGQRHAAIKTVAARWANNVAAGSILEATYRDGIISAAESIGKGRDAAKLVGYYIRKGDAEMQARGANSTTSTPRRPAPKHNGERAEAMRATTLARAETTEDASFWVTHFSHVKDLQGKRYKVTLPELAAKWAAPAAMPSAGKLSLPLVCPFLYHNDNRGKGSVIESVSCLMLDYDDDHDFSAVNVASWWGGLRYLAHTSASHNLEKKGKTCPRGRVIVALSRPVTLDEYSRLADLVLAGGFGQPGDELRTRGRAYFVPRSAPGYWLELSTPSTSPGRVAHSALDVDAILHSLAAVDTLGDRTVVEVGENVWEHTAAIRVALGGHPWLFARAGSLVHVIKTAEGRKVQIVTSTALAPLMSQVVKVHVMTAKGPKPTAPTDSLCSRVLDLKYWHGIVRPLRGIVRAPVLREDGTLHQAKGYDPVTHLYYDRTGVVPPIHPAPSLDDATEAAQRLISLVSECRWSYPAAPAAWLAAVLTPFARSLYTGPAPMFLFEANKAGAGKTMLARIAMHIAAGSSGMFTSYKKDDFERIFSDAVLDFEPVLLVDNVRGPIVSANLEAYLTSGQFTGRRLHKGKEHVSDAITTIYMTANNADIGGDMDRRIMPCNVLHQDAGVYTSDPEAMVRDDRGSYVADCLTILMHHLQASDAIDLDAFASYGQWGGIVRGAVVRAGLLDPCLARKQRGMTGSTETERDRMFAWLSDAFGDREFGASDITTVCLLTSGRGTPGMTEHTAHPWGWPDTAALVDDLNWRNKRGELSPRSIGKRIAQHLNNEVGGVLLLSGESSRKGKVYRLTVAPNTES